jgi:hypothetical protein
MCHPKKCTAPNQSVRYIGFSFDTHCAPCLCIPLHKREQAVAIVEYLISTPNDQSFSRLNLAVAVGILQSLIEATPSHLENTYFRSSPNNQSFSRLSLVVAVGILQLLVEATLSQLESNYSWSFHSVVRPPGLGSGAKPYYTKGTIPFKLRQDLGWWGQEFLIKGEGHFCRMHHSAMLVPNWGDGSGTGTGGTPGIPNRPLKMWQG